MMHTVCYLRQESNVFETYWTTVRGVEAMDNSYRLLDLTVYGRQEPWEDSPTGWPQLAMNWGQRSRGEQFRTDGRPIALRRLPPDHRVHPFRLPSRVDIRAPI